MSSDARQQLQAGIPAAIVSGGQTYVLAADPRQLAQYAGQTVRISGQTSSQNILIPSRLEVRQSGGDFREVSMNFNNTSGAGNSGRSAQDR
jgi:hypothetical protein